MEFGWHRMLLSLAVLLVSVAGWNPDASEPPLVATLLSDKPGPLAVSVAPRREVTSAFEPAIADLRLRATRETRSVTIAVEGFGAVQAVGPRTVTFSGAPAGAERTSTLSYRVRSTGEGRLAATVTALGARGERLGPVSMSVYVLAGKTEALHGNTGTLDLEVLRLERERAAGKLDAAAYDEAYADTVGGGATETSATIVGGKAATISGVVRWTDSAGKTHPVRLATVFASRGSRRGTEKLPEATTMTDENGRYSLIVNREGAYYLQVLAGGPQFRILTFKGVRQRLVSRVHVVDGGDNLALDVTANNVDDNNTAFSVADAVLTATQYFERNNGSPFPALDVCYPCVGTFALPVQRAIFVHRGDRFDWDVVMHEFGHLVSWHLGFSDNPGGSHFGGVHANDMQGSKHAGTRLAWDEGWATYFGTTGQHVMGTASFGIRNVGDTAYSDTEDITFEYDLETVRGFAPDVGEIEFPGVGEDDEISVQRVLWDLADGAPDAGDAVSLGERAVWDALDSSDSITMSGASKAILGGRGAADRALVGCVLTEHQVAPGVVAPADGIALPKKPPTFSWEPNGRFQEFNPYPNDRFVVQFYDAGFTRLLHASPVLSVTSFTPDAQTWSSIVRAANGDVRWQVIGSQTDEPATGPYPSCSWRLRSTG